MLPADLIWQLETRGFALRAAGGQVLVSPAGKLTPKDRADIRAHKPALLAALLAREADPCLALCTGGRVVDCSPAHLPGRVVCWARPGDRQWTDA